MAEGIQERKAGGKNKIAVKDHDMADDLESDDNDMFE